MKKSVKRWLAILLVVAMTWNEAFAMNVQAGGIPVSSQIPDEVISSQQASDGETMLDEEASQEETDEVTVEDETLGENTTDEAVLQQTSEATQENVEALITKDISKASISDVYGAYQQVYVPSGFVGDNTKLKQIAATLPKEVYVALDDGTTENLTAAGDWSVDGSYFINTVNTSAGTKEVSIECTYLGSCNNYSVEFAPTQVKPGETYKVTTTADGTRNVRLGYQLLTNTSGNVSAKLKFDSRTTAHKVLDTLSDEYTVNNANVSDSGEYVFIAFDSSKEVSSRKAYVMGSTASIDIRSTGNISKVTGFAQKLYVSSTMLADTAFLTKLATVLPKKACIVSDLGEEIDVATADAWTYNATTGAFENRVTAIPSGMADPNNILGSTTISMPVAKNNDTGNIQVTAYPTSASVGGSTYIYIDRYMTNYAGTYLCRLPGDNSTGAVYDTSGSQYDQSESDTGTAYFHFTNLQSSDAGEYCGIVADTVSAATRRYAYVTGNTATLTVTGTAACTHSTLASKFTWNTSHTTCTYTLTCSSCNKEVKKGSATVTKKTTAATCGQAGSTVYTARITYNGKTYSDTYTETIPATGNHTAVANFTWSGDYETCSYVITCSTCNQQLATGSATVTKNTTEATCCKDGSTTYNASVTYNGTTYQAPTKTKVISATGNHTVVTDFTWSGDYETCSYVITCSTGKKQLATGNATVTKNITEATCGKDGSATYNASVTYNGTTYQAPTKTKTIPATGIHTPNVDFTWSGDHEICSYKVTCTGCSATLATGNATVTKNTTAATCSKAGSIVYSAKVVYGGKTYNANPYTETIPMLPHQYTMSSKWSTDHTSCTFTLTCGACGHIVTDTVSSNISTKEPTCTSKGLKTYTASWTYNGAVYTATPYEEYIAMLDHTYVDGEEEQPTYRKAGHKAGRHCQVCGQAESGGNTIPALAFTVKYNGNGNTSGVMSDQSGLRYTDEANLTKCAFTKTSYEFTGWNSKPDGTGISFQNLTQVKDNTALIELVEAGNGTVTLYAQWKRVKCNVTYELNGGINSSGNKTSYQLSELPVTLKDPTKKGYDFAGWYTDSAYQNRITAITSVESDVILYAKWTEKTYRITFTGNNATSGYMSEQTVPYTYTGTLQANTYERTGYHFIGWNSRLDGTGVSFADLDAVASVLQKVEAYGSDNTITLYAQWRPEGINIVYTLNGGTNSADNPDLYVGDTITLSKPVRAGYTFSGWYRDASYKNKITFISNEKIDNILDSNGEISLYAKWTANKYRITFAGNGGTGTMSSISGTYKTGTLLPANTFKKTGYTFSYWKGSDGKSYKNKADLAPLATSTTAKTITLTAQWTLTRYKLTYVLNGGTNSSSNPSTYTYVTTTFSLKNPTRKGCTFVGWYSDSKYKTKVTQIAKGTTGSKTLYAKWTLTKYKINYVLNGGTNSSSNPTTYTYTTATFTLKNPARKGYTFAGWYSDSKYKTKVTQIIKGTTGSKTLYAKWTLTKYKINYVLNGGTNSSSNPSTYTYVTTTFSLKNPTRKGCTFVGWYSDSKYKTKVTQIAKGTTGSKTLYAKWTLTKYKINYVLNGGTNSSSNPTTYTYTTATFTLKNPARKGYTFAGWYSDSGYKTKVTQITKGTTGSKTLYAKWTLIKYKITYNLNGGTNSSSNPATYTYVTTTFSLKNPTRKGYTFAGWYSDSGYKTKVTQIAKGSTGNKTLYAKWTANKCTVVFNANGGTGTMSNQSFSYGSAKKALTANAFKRTGYTFVGWASSTTNASNLLVKYTNKQTVSNLSSISGAKINLYAVWVKNTTSYDIVYHLNGGTDNGGNPVKYKVTSSTITLKNPTRTGYTFGGWYRDAAFKNRVTSIAKGSYGNQTLYAKWTATEYTITYEIDGGTNSEWNPSNYTIESDTIVLNAPTKEGCTFDGWYLDAEYTQRATEITTGTVGNQTLYARWISY